MQTKKGICATSCYSYWKFILIVVYLQKICLVDILKMSKRNLNIQILHKLFAEIYFYNLKENKGIQLKDFKSGGDKVLYENFFSKYNILADIIKTKKKANNEIQRMRLYTCIRKAVSIN